MSSEMIERTRFSIQTPDALADPAEQEQLGAWLEHQSPQRILQWAVETFGTDLVMTSSFGLNGVTLIHMLQEVTQDVPIIFVDTGYMFKETLKTKEKIQAAYGIEVLTYRPRLSVQEQARQHGPKLHARQPDMCCALRKIEPMRRAMAELKPLAVLNGRARFQADTRRNLPVVEWGQTPLRVNPLAFWTLQQIKAYVKAHDVPCNPLHEAGYPSIGCRPCTQPVQVGERIRVGRWAGLGKTECGLWTTSYATAD